MITILLENIKYYLKSLRIAPSMGQGMSLGVPCVDEEIIINVEVSLQSAKNCLVWFISFSLLLLLMAQGYWAKVGSALTKPTRAHIVLGPAVTSGSGSLFDWFPW